MGFVETRRLSQQLAYVKWKHVTQDATYMVEVAPSRKGEGKEAVSVEMQMETNEFVAGKLEGDKEYIVTVSARSSHGDILARGTHSIPLPREEHVPTPRGVRVTAVKKSLSVSWEVSPMQALYIMFHEINAFTLSYNRQSTHKLMWKDTLSRTTLLLMLALLLERQQRR